MNRWILFALAMPVLFGCRTTSAGSRTVSEPVAIMSQCEAIRARGPVFPHAAAARTLESIYRHVLHRPFYPDLKNAGCAAIFGHLRDIEQIVLWPIGAENLGRFDLRLVPAFPQVTRVVVASSPWPLGFSALANSPQLKELKFYRMQGRDAETKADLSRLVEMKNIIRLHIHFSPTLFQSPEWLPQLTHMQHLILRDNDLSSVEFVASLSKLETFDVFNNPLVTEPPSTWPASLKHIDIRNTGFGADVFPTLPAGIQTLAIDQRLDTAASRCTLLKKLAQLNKLTVGERVLTEAELQARRAKCKS